MSTGFRLLLLILLGFGAVWIYRFRAPELNLLLNPTRPVLADPIRGLPMAGDRAWGRLEPPARTGWEQVSSPNWDPESWSPERLEAGETPWRETENQAERTEYERIEHDPDLVFGAFEESSDGMIHTPYEENLLAPHPEEVADGGDEGSRPDVKPGTVEVEYVVEKGDDLWTVAAKFLGKGYRYDEIIRLNSLASETIVPGTRLKLHVPDHRAPKESLKSTPPSDDKSVEESSGLDESSLTLKTHKVKAGETLSEIASRYFPGRPGQLQAICEANRETVSSPDEILEGQILVIPSSQ